ncbi:MAG: hypothetical protein JSU08_06530 [Acidobacteria bacterium]|nr:hypothetical protein [Acidobacteriota bacterium]
MIPAVAALQDGRPARTRSWLARQAGVLDRHRLVIVLAFTLVYSWIVYVRASGKPFWHDEIFTLIIATRGSLREIWAAHLAGLDLMPPLNAALTHAFIGVFGLGAVTGRLPAMIGVWAASVIGFAFVRQRRELPAALIALMLPLLLGSATMAYEARGYGLMLGLFALSMYAWSELARGRRPRLSAVVLSASLAGSIWAHYYAAINVFPIVVGEAFRLVRTKRLDWLVIAALGTAMISAAPLAALVRVASAQAATYWRHPSLGDLQETYALLLGPHAGVFAIVAVTILGVVTMLAAAQGAHTDAPPQALAAHEVAAGVATLLIPVVTWLTGVLVTGVFVPRYALSAVFGLSTGIPLALATLGRFARVRTQAGMLLCALAFAYSYRDARPGGHASFANPVGARPALSGALAGRTPVIVSSTLFLQVWYYASEAQRLNLYAVADPGMARRLIGTDTVDLGYVALRNWYPAQIQSYAEFTSAHREFLVYGTPALNWIADKLREDGATLQTVTRESGASLQAVLLPAGGGTLRSRGGVAHE